MSVCNPCIKTKVLPNCLTQLVVGIVALVSQTVKVYIQDLATGGLTILDGTTDNTGLLTVEFPEPNIFFDNHPYELWVTDIGAGVADFAPITINGTTSDVVCLRFQQVKGGDGTVEAYLTQTLIEA